MGETDRGVAQREMQKVVRGEPEWASDDLAVEAPLQVRLAGEPFVVTMRTPGQDRDLVLGLLWSEGLIESLDDVSVMAPCADDAFDVRPGPGVVLAPERSRRGTLTSASCGLCGREQIDDLVQRLRLRSRPDHVRSFRRDALDRALAHLESHQPSFAKTGAMHAALAADAKGDS